MRIRIIIIIKLLFFSTLCFSQNNNEFTSIPVDRINGFYATTNYYTGIDFENIKLTEVPDITISDISNIKKSLNYHGKPTLNITLTKEAGEKFYTLTEKNVSKPIAIVVNKKIISMPIVFSPISEGNLVLDGISEEEIDTIIETLTIEE